jgi:hypothetical protein
LLLCGLLLLLQNGPLGHFKGSRLVEIFNRPDFEALGAARPRDSCHAARRVPPAIGKLRTAVAVLAAAVLTLLSSANHKPHRRIGVNYYYHLA